MPLSGKLCNLVLFGQRLTVSQLDLVICLWLRHPLDPDSYTKTTVSHEHI